MSDTSPDGTPDAPPSKKATPWSVKKIVEQVTGRPLESMQDPPGTRRPAARPAPTVSNAGPPLERYHQEGGPAVAVLLEREETAPSRMRLEDIPEPSTVESRGERSATPEGERSPSLQSFLPGAPGSSPGRSGRPASLPLTRPLPREVIEEVQRGLPLGDDDEPTMPPLDVAHPHKRSELERVYLTYLLMHLDKLTEPALKYLRHAIEEECEERGLRR